MVESINGEPGIMGIENRPDYMNERVFQRNRLPPRAYFLPAEHLSLSGKWRFRYASSPLEPDPEPEPVDGGAWNLIDVPGKLVLRLFESSFKGQTRSTIGQLRGQKPVEKVCRQHCREDELCRCKQITSAYLIVPANNFV